MFIIDSGQGWVIDPDLTTLHLRSPVLTLQSMAAIIQFEGKLDMNCKDAPVHSTI